jgi:hypothetical protein
MSQQPLILNSRNPKVHSIKDFTDVDRIAMPAVKVSAQAVLLEMARGQKLDLAHISILALVDQYLAVIEGARRVRLELAADWLVMAAWLAWLKSRLLLPESEEDPEAEIAAELLATRLRDLAQARHLALWLQARPMLGRDVWVRGAPESLVETDRSGGLGGTAVHLGVRRTAVLCWVLLAVASVMLMPLARHW